MAATSETTSSKARKTAPKKVDSHEIIVVKSGFNGQLVYISPKTQEKFVWDSFGEEQEMELGELRNAKSSAKAFFANNWFMFDEEYDWVIDYIGVRQYYENAIRLDEFDDILTGSPDEITAKVTKMSEGQKQSLAYRARQMIADGEIDSRKAIIALENALGLNFDN